MLQKPLPRNRLLDVVGIGRNSWDRIAVVDHYPKADTKTEALVWDNQPGGQVATAIVAASRLGARTRYLGKFGDDAAGRAVRGALVREGIDLSESKVIPGVCNQTAFIVVDQTHKTRNVFGYVDPRLRLSADDFSYEAVTSGRILYLGARNPKEVVSFAQMGKHAGCLVAIDADNVSDGIHELLALADIVLCPEDFCLALGRTKSIRTAMKKLVAMGPTTICATRGNKGAIGLLGTNFFHVSAYKVKILDTTGAGDVFHGAFLQAIIKNLSFKTALRFASAAAALKCQTIGGQKGIPTQKAVQRFLSSRT